WSRKKLRRREACRGTRERPGSFRKPLSELLDDPARFDAGEVLAPRRRGRAAAAVADDVGEHLRVLVGERLGQERRAESALQGEAMAGAAVLAHHLHDLGAPLGIERSLERL